MQVVVGWFEGPDHLTVHALGGDGAQVPPEGASHPLEWPQAGREVDRAAALAQRLGFGVQVR